jgi:SAM-dependent methyltransferase
MIPESGEGNDIGAGDRPSISGSPMFLEFRAHFPRLGSPRSCTVLPAGHHVAVAVAHPPDVTSDHSGSLYDKLGAGYRARRRADPRIGRLIWSALGDARTVLNVGAGTGLYEPADREVLAVEPSAVMRAQRPVSCAPCIEAAAEDLPFADQAFDAAMAVLSDHHWSDPLAGLTELRRVARRVVVFCWDSQMMDHFWLVADYLPELIEISKQAPSVAERAQVIGAQTHVVGIPWDCRDGFLHAHWRRPANYLDSEVRSGASSWRRVGADVEERVVASLREDLYTGRWHSRHRELLALDELDLGARLLVGDFEGC